MIPLHKFPGGLLQLLNLRNVGRGPESLAPEVRGIIDVREFYASNLLVLSSGAPSVGGLAGLEETVTFTTTLALKAMCAALTIGAGAATNLQLTLGVRDPLGTELTLASTYLPNAAAAQLVSHGVIVPNWIMPAQWVMFARASGAAAGADHSLDVVGLIENYVSGQ